MSFFIISILLFIIFIPADLMYLMSNNIDVINADMNHYLKESPLKGCGILNLNYSLLRYKTFRNIFYYRNSKNKILRIVSKLFIKPLNSVEIVGNIAGGLLIPHNFCVIAVESAGENLCIGPGVVIGKGKDNLARNGLKRPIIGNNVEIGANATLFGGIIIGDNVKIGAGAVVNKDVPSNCCVVGNPMEVIVSNKEIELFC